MFDVAEVKVEAGKGGNGAASFRREKFVPHGGPDGGDGGRGGDVVMVADSAVTNLKLFNHRRVYRAGNGLDGSGRKQHGKDGTDKELVVPVGTVVMEVTEMGGGRYLADLEQPGQRVVVAKGGRGGRGNVHYATSTNQAPRLAQTGEPGEEKTLTLELRLIADVGIIGYPNVGKSSLLAAASAAHPKIAGYPFTTLEPVPGVVVVDHHSFVMAEIPGLIDGASLGRGLGHDFLRHVVRTRLLLHLVDGATESPLEDMLKVNNELALFDSALARKPQLVAVNKVDLPEVRQRMKELRQELARAGVEAHFVSAASGEGVAGLMQAAMQVLGDITVVDSGMQVPDKVFRPQPSSSGVGVQKQDDVFVVTSAELERVIGGTDITDSEARRQLIGQLTRPHISRALEKAGVRAGDRVRCGGLEWRW